MFLACVMCVYGVRNVRVNDDVCVCCVRVYVYAGTRCMYDGF